MKKLLAILLLFSAALLFAETDLDETLPGDDAGARADAVAEDFAEDTEDAPAAAPKKEFRLKNRTVEFAVDVSGSFANDVIAAKHVLFRDVAEISLDDIFKGIKLDFGAALTPLSVNFNWKDKWGFSLPFISLEASGDAEIIKDVLNFRTANREKFGPGGAAFLDLGVPVFFHVGDLKVKLRPAGYLPLAYTSPGLYYTYTTTPAPGGGQTILLQMDFEQRFFMGLPDEYMAKLQKVIDGETNFDADFFGIGGGSLQDTAQSIGNLLWDITSYLGYDLGFGLEYPVNESLDAGVDITHIPLYRARLDNFVQMTGQAYFDSSKVDINKIIAGDMDMSDAYDADYQFSTGKGSMEQIWRPFKMVFYANYRPFYSRVFSLIPSAGFALNPMYVSIGSFEGGLKARFDLGNIFVTTIGVGYEDRKWKNSIDFVLFNLRALELDVGITFQSQDFVKSWQGAGLAAKASLKFGW